MRLTKTSVALTVSALLACAAVVVSLAAVRDEATPPASDTPTRVAPMAANFEALQDDQAFPGMAMSDALLLIAEHVVLPVTDSTVEKVLIDETPGLSRAERGIAVRYSSGFNFYYKPLPQDTLPDWQKLVNDSDAAPFTDGRAEPFEIVDINGVEVAVQRGGVQELRRGLVPVGSAASWNDDSGTYILRSDKLPAEQLLSIAGDLITNGARSARAR